MPLSAGLAGKWSYKKYTMSLVMYATNREGTGKDEGLEKEIAVPPTINNSSE